MWDDLKAQLFIVTTNLLATLIVAIVQGFGSGKTENPLRLGRIPHQKKNMNKKLIHFILLALIAQHLFTRTWPFGTTIQTITDIIYLAAACVMGYQWIFMRQPK